MKVNHPSGGPPEYYYKYKIIKSNILIIYFQNIFNRETKPWDQVVGVRATDNFILFVISFDRFIR